MKIGKFEGSGLLYQDEVHGSLLIMADNVPVQIRIEDDAMYISNCSMLPFGWTAETLLDSHSSKPYNPDIARVFYRAGYIESWGRGIQKIRDACKNLGTDEPEYMVHGEDIMVKFKALQSAKVTEKVTEKVTDIENRILVILRERLYVTYDEMAKEVGVSRKTISQKIKMLKEKGIITRVGSAKKGYWTITAQ